MSFDVHMSEAQKPVKRALDINSTSDSAYPRPLPIFYACEKPVKTGVGIWSRYRVCRRCRKCLRRRRREWIDRINLELKSAPRTWFVTLTYRGKKEPTYEDVRKFLNRLRSKKGSFRYIAVTERGSKNGRLHWHILLHCEHAFKKRDIAGCWSAGFRDIRLAKGSGFVRYITKIARYVTKSEGRIRASVSYGLRPLREIKERRDVELVLSCFPGAEIKRVRYRDGTEVRVPFNMRKEMVSVAREHSVPSCSCPMCSGGKPEHT